ncbi:T-cell activation Rho GTPase-activating protein, partial [Antrostomus carolinensis]
DFLRNIPSKLLSADLYEEWMQALEKPSKQEKIEELKDERSTHVPLPGGSVICLSLQNRICKYLQGWGLHHCPGQPVPMPENPFIPLEVQKEMNDKVTVLVEFLINNCSEIFGEDIALFVCASSEESPEHTDSSTEHLCAVHQNDSAYDSPDPEAEGSSCTSQMEQPKGRSTSVSRRYPTCISAPSLTNFRNDISTMDRRRYSEPDLSFQNRLEGRIRKQKLNKSEDDFPFQQKQLGLEALEKPLAILASQLSTDSLPKTSSSCSLESSDGSVFTSSPVVSPSSPKKTFLNRPQSFSTKATEDCSTPSREIKKHSMSFSFANRRKTLIKTQSWGPGKNMGFQRDSFTKKEDHFSCRVVQNSPDDDKPLPMAYQQRPRFRSADEVFREVDQRNPGSPPSYEEATKNCLTTNVTSHNLTVQSMRLKLSNQDALSPHPCSSCPPDAAYTALGDLPHGRVSAAKGSDVETETLSITVGINSRVSLPVTPGVYRLRAMSESCQKNKLEYVARRCSQPVFEVDQIQYAKESYV